MAAEDYLSLRPTRILQKGIGARSRRVLGKQMIKKYPLFCMWKFLSSMKRRTNNSDNIFLREISLLFSANRYLAERPLLVWLIFFGALTLLSVAVYQGNEYPFKFLSFIPIIFSLEWLRELLSWQRRNSL